MQVQDRVFVVTGGGTGIGREVVIRLLGEEGQVAAVDLRAEALEGLRSLAGADRLSTHGCDVSDEDAVRATDPPGLSRPGARPSRPSRRRRPDD